MRDTCGTPPNGLTADPPLRSARTNCSSSGGCASISDSSTVRTSVDLPETGGSRHDTVRTVAALVEGLHVKEQQLAVVRPVTERDPAAASGWSGRRADCSTTRRSRSRRGPQCRSRTRCLGRRSARRVDRSPRTPRPVANGPPAARTARPRTRSRRRRGRKNHLLSSITIQVSRSRG